ncbi:hypothetical protein GCM10012285_58050 [Streptomyces kronopolitis]|uniref:Uncharacterized protein n=1 Tax=Streptomyces kronopolitis TaxID=1612435 RepID=A0ABQ2JZ20_9ACTN|nr:hypothetical protein GCM10012285_58050 [Streptomyces kronopolitis]
MGRKAKQSHTPTPQDRHRTQQPRAAAPPAAGENNERTAKRATNGAQQTTAEKTKAWAIRHRTALRRPLAPAA